MPKMTAKKAAPITVPGLDKSRRTVCRSVNMIRALYGKATGSLVGRGMLDETALGNQDWPMRFLARFKRGELRLTRVEAFSDGVFAIVVTLLVLDLRVPTLTNPHSATELAHELVELLPKFVSWLISFVIVCKFWLNHHYVLGLARCADYAMVWLNSIFLMFQSFVPFPTALMGEYPKNPLAISVFGAVMAINTLSPSRLWGRCLI
jgi:hypothetical protein